VSSTRRSSGSCDAAEIAGELITVRGIHHVGEPGIDAVLENVDLWKASGTNAPRCVE
jgi:hypothetical protein